MLTSLAIFILGVCPIAVNALYFNVRATPKCFQLEQPKGTPIVFSYELVDEASAPVSFSLYYGIVQDETLLIKREAFDAKTGHVNFDADVSGYYTYCLIQPSASPKPTKVKMMINYGFDLAYYDKIAKSESYDPLGLEIRKLNDQLAIVLNEADYQKSKEVQFHEQTERMNSSATWWPMMQVAILVGTALFQVQHLKVFFKSNKIV